MTAEQTPDPDLASRRLAAESLAKDDPTGWFEELYAAAGEGKAVVPWDRGGAHALLTEWAETSEFRGDGKRALVVGTGLGWDAELVADLGYDTIAFDISPSAVEAARQTHPDTKVDYVVADLLNPPAEWRGAFDLVVEIYTVQALPIELQPAASKQVTAQVRVGGTLVVIAAVRTEVDGRPVSDDVVQGPPWPLTRAAIDAFAIGDVRLIQLEKQPSPSDPTIYRWRAEYLRD
ncbi:class I SAM-dependent methyltransferase [Kribbella qitaiheensis]|uniref:Class I SAM-dependent methyltransferase n=1 Tax=Kribbella qitaiheensis TaxID=1544730 RepID=A0A7G6WTS2_9ACTN|nr:class I SAM-dependent methyltransferase [Kribbella qitaiheensis]QNE17387.1 class I SAM-dependent methyltransferase [Kribbella qitaiheensis]